MAIHSFVYPTMHLPSIIHPIFQTFLQHLPLQTYPSIPPSIHRAIQPINCSSITLPSSHLLTHKPTCQNIHPSIHRSSVPLIDLSMHHNTCLSTCLSIHLSIHPSTHPSPSSLICLSIHPSTDPSNHLPFIHHPSKHPPTHPQTNGHKHPSITLSIYQSISLSVHQSIHT